MYRMKEATMSSTMVSGSGTLDSRVTAFLLGAPEAAETVKNPHPLYDELRSQHPAYRTETGLWLATSYDACAQLTRNRDWKRGLTKSGTTSARPIDEELASEDLFLQLAKHHVLSNDPPHHTRMRKVVGGVFTPARLAQWRDQLAQLATETVARVRDRESIDFLHELAWGYPVDALALVIGLPSEVRDLLFQITELSMRHLEPAFVPTAESVAQDNEVLSSYIAWVRDLIAFRRAHPDDSVIWVWIQAMDAGELSEMELLSNIRLMHMAGHETTASTISNAMLCLLRNPAQLELLRSNTDEFASSTVEEVLRYSAAANLTMTRVAEKDMELGGATIPAGETVVAVLGAANRDPERFENPHRFDITRKPNPHMAFGAGLHACVGAPLARLEAPLALGEVVRSFTDFSYNEDDVHWRPTFMFRTLESLPMSWKAVDAA
jgi:cytochrome P450